LQNILFSVVLVNVKTGFQKKKKRKKEKKKERETERQEERKALIVSDFSGVNIPMMG